MRVLQLDLLRFVAVFLVLGRHMAPAPPEQGAFLHGLTSVWHRGGWIGVDLFFVLSGFLVSGLLFREFQGTGGVRAGHFLIRRGWKIYPPFWLLMAATVAVEWGRGEDLGTFDVIGELLFLQNYLGRLWAHTWSLAVEEHFYFLLAGWVAWRCRRTPDEPFAGLPWLFAGVAAACLLLRALTAASVPYDNVTHLFPTHLRIDSLLFGVLLSYGWHFGTLREHPRLSRMAPWLGAVGLLLVVPPFVFALETTPWLPVVGLSALYLGSGSILLALLYVPEARFRALRPFAQMGAYSYSIYLWHMPAALYGVPAVASLLGRPLAWSESAALYLVGSIGFGIATARIVEIPALRLRDRLYPSRSGALPPG